MAQRGLSDGGRAPHHSHFGMVPNDEIIQFAHDNSDVAIPLRQYRSHASGPRKPCAKRSALVAAGARGLKPAPAAPAVFAQRSAIAYPLYEVFAEAEAARVVPHWPQRHRDRDARRRRHPPEVRQPDAHRRRRSRLPRSPHHPRAPVTSPGRMKRFRSASTSRRFIIDLSGWSPKYFPRR